MPPDIRDRMSATNKSRYDIDHRAALFGQQYASKRDDPEAGIADPSAMERENDLHVRDLSDKVTSLKATVLSIQGALKESSSILSGMGDQFDSATKTVKTTVGRVGALIHRKTGHPMWHFALFVIAAFILMWFLFHK